MYLSLSEYNTYIEKQAAESMYWSAKYPNWEVTFQSGWLPNRDRGLMKLANLQRDLQQKSDNPLSDLRFYKSELS